MAPLSGGTADPTNNVSNNPLTAANWQRMQEASMDFANVDQRRSRKKSRSASPVGAQAASAPSNEDVPKFLIIPDKASRDRSASPRKTDQLIRIRDYSPSRNLRRARSKYLGHEEVRGKDLRHARRKDLSHEELRKSWGWEHHPYPLPEEILKPGDGPADVRQRIRVWYHKQDSIKANEPATLLELDVYTQRIERERKEREAKHAAIVAGVDVYKTAASSAPLSMEEAVALTMDEEDIAMAEGEEQTDVTMGEVEDDDAVQAKFKDSGIHMHSEENAAVADTAGNAQGNVDIDIDLTSDTDTDTNAAPVTAQEDFAQATFKDSGIHVNSDDDTALSDTAGQVQDNDDINIDIGPTSENTTNADTDAETAALISQAEELVQTNAASTTGGDGAADNADKGFASENDVYDCFGGESQSTEHATQDSDVSDDSEPDLFAPSSSDYKGKSKKAALVLGDEGYIAPPPTEYDGILGTFTPDMEVNLGGDSSSDNAVSSATDDTDPELQAALLESIQPAAGDTSALVADSTTEAVAGTGPDNAFDDNEDASTPVGDATEAQVIVPKSTAFECALLTSEELASRCNTQNMSKGEAGAMVKNFMETNSVMLEGFKFLDVVHNGTVAWQKVSELWFSEERRTEICGVIKLLNVLLEQFWPDIAREDRDSLQPRLEAHEALSPAVPHLSNLTIENDEQGLPLRLGESGLEEGQLEQSQQQWVSFQQALSDIQGSNKYRKELIDLTGLAPSLFVDLLLSAENVVPQIENETSEHKCTDAEEPRLNELQRGLRRIIDMLKCNVTKSMRDTGNDPEPIRAPSRDRNDNAKLSPEEDAKRLRFLDGMVEVNVQEMVSSEDRFPPYDSSSQVSCEVANALGSWKILFPPQAWSSTAAEANMRGLIDDDFDDENDTGEVKLPPKSGGMRAIRDSRLAEVALKQLTEADGTTMVGWMQQHMLHFERTMKKLDELRDELSHGPQWIRDKLENEYLKSDFFSWWEDHTDQELLEDRREEQLWHRDYAIRCLRRTRCLIRKWLHIRKDKTGGTPAYIRDLLPKIETAHAELLTIQSETPVTYPWVCFRSLCVYGATCRYGENCANIQGPGHSVVSTLGMRVSSIPHTTNPGGPCPFVNRLNGCPQQQLGTCPYAHYNKGQTCSFWLKGACRNAPEQCAFVHGQSAGSAPPPSPMLDKLVDLKLRIGDVTQENKWLGACAFVNTRQGCTKATCTYNHTLKGVSCPKSDGDGSCSWLREGQQCRFEHTRDGYVGSGQTFESSKREGQADGFGPVNKRIQLAGPPVGAPIGPRAAVGQAPGLPLPLGQIQTAQYPSPMGTSYGQKFPYGGFPVASSHMGSGFLPPWQPAPGQQLQRQHQAPANAPRGPKSMTQSLLSPAGRVAVQQGQSGQAIDSRRGPSGNEIGNMLRQTVVQQAAAGQGSSVQQAQSGPIIAPPPTEFKSFAELLKHTRVQKAAAGQGELNGGSKRKYSNYGSHDGRGEASSSRPKRSRNNGSHNNDNQAGGDEVPDARPKRKKFNGNRNGGSNGRTRRGRHGD